MDKRNWEKEKLAEKEREGKNNEVGERLGKRKEGIENKKQIVLVLLPTSIFYSFESLPNSFVLFLLSQDFSNYFYLPLLSFCLFIHLNYFSSLSYSTMRAALLVACHKSGEKSDCLCKATRNALQL